MQVDFVDLLEPIPIKYHIDHGRAYELWESNYHILEPIPKGIRYQCLIDTHGNIHFKTRFKLSRHSDISDRINHIADELKMMGVPNDTLLDGYLTVGDRNNTVKILESGVENAAKYQIDFGKLKFIIVDVLFYEDKKAFYFPLFDRKKLLQEKFLNTRYVQIINYYYDHKRDEFEKLKNKYEMFVFKSLEADYVFGRSAGWKYFRVKKTVLLKVLDVIEGRGKFTGMCGTLAVGKVKAGEVTNETRVSSGMTMDQRLMFYKFPKKYIGKDVEVDLNGNVFVKIFKK